MRRPPNADAAPRTEAERTHEELGLKLGRACAADPRFHAMVLRGFARAQAEVDAGRKPAAGVREAIGDVGSKVAELVGIGPTPRRRRALSMQQSRLEK